MKQTGALKAATHLFCFISFIGIYYPLTDIVIIHIFYINESNPYTPLVTIFHIQICYQLLQTTHPTMLYYALLVCYHTLLFVTIRY